MNVIRLIGLFAAALALQSCIERLPDKVAKRESPVSGELRTLVEEQGRMDADRSLTADRKLFARQRQRRAVYRLISQALVREADDLYLAARILSVTDSPLESESLLLAHTLALEAMSQGAPNAGLLAAQSLDKYLFYSGQLQRYGTVVDTLPDGTRQLYPTDSSTTDLQRRELGLPSLDSLRLILTR